MSDWNFAEIHLDNHVIVFYNDKDKGLYEQDTEIVVFTRLSVIKKQNEFLIKLERSDSDWTVEYTVKEINYVFEPIWYRILDQLAPKHP
jgi:hypothetical protein